MIDHKTDFTMHCAQCDRPLLQLDAICAHCDAGYQPEQEVTVRDLGDVGQYSCPACSKRFDEPGTINSKPVPWYMPETLPPPGCPHCHRALLWLPATPVAVVPKTIAQMSLASFFFLTQSTPSSLRRHWPDDWLATLLRLVLLFAVFYVSTTLIGRATWSPQASGQWGPLPIKTRTQMALRGVGWIGFGVLLGWLLMWRWRANPLQQELAWWALLFLVVGASITLILSGLVLPRQSLRAGMPDWVSRFLKGRAG